MTSGKKVALVLAGCGNKDGAEITEAVSLLIALSQHGARVDCFSIDAWVEAKNFLTDQPIEKRNLLQESARISRSRIHDLKALQVDSYDALAFAGGYGVALHFCDWAHKGAAAQVHPEVKRVIESFASKGKPIGAVCIAPVLLGLVLGSQGPSLTLGEDTESLNELTKTGATAEPCGVTEFISDRLMKVVTTPAYMDSKATPAQVFQGVSGLVRELLMMA